MKRFLAVFLITACGWAAPWSPAKMFKELFGPLYQMPVAIVGDSHAAALVTWTLVQYPNSNCTSIGTTTSLACTVTVSSTVAGDLLVLLSAADNTNGHLSSYSSASGDGAWTHCPSTAANITTSDNAVVDCAYRLSATGGATSLTFTWTYASTPTSNELVDLLLLEFTRSTGTATYDTSGHNTNSNCGTSCSAEALTLAGSADVMIELALINGSDLAEITGVTSPFATSPSPFLSLNLSDGYALALGPATGSAPAWTTPGSVSIAMGAVAFK